MFGIATTFKNQPKKAFITDLITSSLIYFGQYVRYINIFLNNLINHKP